MVFILSFLVATCARTSIAGSQDLVANSMIVPVRGMLRIFVATNSSIFIIGFAVVFTGILSYWLGYSRKDHLKGQPKGASSLGEEERFGSEEKFRELLEAVPDAMVIANEDGRILLVNRQTETLFGYNRTELVGQPVEILVPDAFKSRHIGHRTQYMKSPKVRSMGVGLELFAIRKDGQQFPVEISLSPLHTGEGTLISASVRNITDRKKSEEKFRGLLEAAHDAMVIADEQGRIVLINRQTEKLFGYGREELIGKPVELLLPDKFRGSHEQHRTRYMEAPKLRAMGVGLELFALRKDGVHIPVEISLSPLQTGEGTLISPP